MSLAGAVEGGPGWNAIASSLLFETNAHLRMERGSRLSGVHVMRLGGFPVVDNTSDFAGTGLELAGENIEVSRSTIMAFANGIVTAPGADISGLVMYNLVLDCRASVQLSNGRGLSLRDLFVSVFMNNNPHRGNWRRFAAGYAFTEIHASRFEALFSHSRDTGYVLRDCRDNRFTLICCDQQVENRVAYGSNAAVGKRGTGILVSGDSSGNVFDLAQVMAQTNGVRIDTPMGCSNRFTGSTIFGGDDVFVVQRGTVNLVACNIQGSGSRGSRSRGVVLCGPQSHADIYGCQFSRLGVGVLNENGGMLRLGANAFEWSVTTTMSKGE
jgi:hypothetical protein